MFEIELAPMEGETLRTGWLAEWDLSLLPPLRNARLLDI